MMIRVLFGTETGNAEDCAYQLGDALEDAGFSAEVTDMASYTPTDLASERLALVVTSTYGNGDPPYNAEALMTWLRQDTSSVAGISFAVCGLGDQTYPKFGQAGKDFDRLMEERGGRRVVPRVDCDVDYEEPFEQFTEAVVEWLREHGDDLAGAAAPAPVAETTSVASAPTAVLGTRSAPVRATLRGRRRLNATGSAKETMHYEFVWPGSAVQYAPGDSFAVTPENNPAEVAAVLALLGLSGDEHVDSGDGTGTLRDALVRTRDLQVVSSELLAALTSAPNTGEASVPDYLADRHLVDVLGDQAAPSVAPQVLVDGLKKLKPRLYSVANSPLVEAEGVHFTVETLRYERHGRAREGVATTWLADRFDDGDSVAMYCVQAPHFRLPSDGSVPIIMVGPGTGVAPFRAFLQQRQAQGDTGKNWLVFGHQHEQTDFLYRDEMEAWRADGTLTELSLAWSRDQAEKVYVQDKLRERGAEVWSWIAGGAHVYVCGDKNAMAPQVRETIKAIAVEHGAMTPDAAEAALTEWEASGRYAVDAY
ncbi:MAG: sulfite reductase flavoprotein subunit alpha [Myxococcota bacterium]|nr:sulfite reductase flavoprotein subunit alpha [Myxococcota bacterium]